MIRIESYLNVVSKYLCMIVTRMIVSREEMESKKKLKQNFSYFYFLDIIFEKKLSINVSFLFDMSVCVC